MPQEATLGERFAMEEALCSINVFSQVAQLKTRFSTENVTLAKAYATVVHLRTLAQGMVGKSLSGDMSEYYIALLYNALNTLRFSSLDVAQHEHALLSVCLLVDCLKLGENTMQ